MQIRTPLTLITGALGSGETTLLRHILAVVPQKIAILMNEFGEIAVDSKIIAGKNGIQQLTAVTQGEILDPTRDTSSKLTSKR